MSLKDFFNKVSGSDKIYYAEEIGRMNPDEFQLNEPAIDYQISNLGIPREADLVASDEVYVRSYTRDDGTKVRAYYRSKPGSSGKTGISNDKITLLDGKIEYNSPIKNNQMTFGEAFQDSVYTILGQVMPLAYNNLINARYNFIMAEQDNNAHFINDRAELKNIDLKTVMNKIGIPEHSSGVLYDSNSKITRQLENSSTLKAFIKANQKALKNGEIQKTLIDFTPENIVKILNKKDLDNFLGIQHATLYKPIIDKNGYFNALLIDYYDFTHRKGINPFNIPNNWGYSLQQKKLIDNYFNIYYIHKRIK